MCGEKYYRFNEILLSFAGQWPYQDAAARKLLTFLTTVVIFSFLLPLIIKLTESLDDTEAIIECLTPIITRIGTLIKLYNCVFNAEKIRMLFDRLKSNWRKYSLEECDAVILKRYATNGRNVSRIYAIYMYSTVFTYTLITVLPRVLDAVVPLNVSRPYTPLHQAEYYIDGERYYYPILMHAIFSTVVMVTALIGVDTLYMTYVEHVCGTFAIIGNRLQSLAKDDRTATRIDPPKHEDKYFPVIKNCISAHSEAIEYAALIESTYTVMFLVVIGMNVMLMSITGVQVINMMDHPDTMVRFVIYSLAQMLHVFCISLPGQRLIDHSESIVDSITQSDWFKTSLRSRRLLMFMLMRSARPMEITAGKIYTMNMESFSKVLQTSLSYFTVLSSVS